MITIVDMKIGNIGSVVSGFRRVGQEPVVTDDPADVARADRLVLPGVGAFGDGMASLREKRLVEPLRRHVLERRLPLLGICLGMQLLTERGEEHGKHEGLGVLPGGSVRLAPRNDLRVPNIGWCDVAPRDGAHLFPGNGREAFYFAHGYHVACADPANVAATIDYGGEIAAAVERGTVFGVQFHPEKSQDAGLDVLARFAGADA